MRVVGCELQLLLSTILIMNLDKKGNDAWETIFIFQNVGEPGEYAVFKRGMLYYRKTGNKKQLK